MKGVIHRRMKPRPRSNGWTDLSNLSSPLRIFLDLKLVYFPVVSSGNLLNWRGSTARNFAQHLGHLIRTRISKTTKGKGRLPRTEGQNLRCSSQSLLLLVQRNPMTKIIKTEIQPWLTKTATTRALKLVQTWQTTYRTHLSNLGLMRNRYMVDIHLIPHKTLYCYYLG